VRVRAPRARTRPSRISPRDLLRRLGVELLPGDLRDVHSLEVALRGVTTVVSTATGAARRLPGDNLSTVDRDGQRALVDASRRGGVRRFVYVSVSPSLPRTTPLVASSARSRRPCGGAAWRGSWSSPRPSWSAGFTAAAGSTSPGPGGAMGVRGRARELRVRPGTRRRSWRPWRIRTPA